MSQAQGFVIMAGEGNITAYTQCSEIASSSGSPFIALNNASVIQAGTWDFEISGNTQPTNLTLIVGLDSCVPASSVVNGSSAPFCIGDLSSVYLSRTFQWSSSSALDSQAQEAWSVATQAFIQANTTCSDALRHVECLSTFEACDSNGLTQLMCQETCETTLAPCAVATCIYQICSSLLPCIESSTHISTSSTSSSISITSTTEAAISSASAICNRSSFTISGVILLLHWLSL